MSKPGLFIFVIRFQTTVAQLRGDVLVEPRTHLLAGLEKRRGFLLHRNMRSGAGVAASASRAVLHGEDAEVAQLHAIAACQRTSNLIKNSVDDLFDVA